ncbi:lipase/acyltransferase domain-containing protein [Burkholderia sp. Ac-20379]|uniref:lipase/acyltransferase domain-containing protein n=1 Tax=Burkholderia sp. Ac-20379 TaxID=2703900 RepID=UPI00197CC2B6|nr:hypothetical protein [Burkholderia sp. Ac-20379]MBN3729126.1 hypothetical protein [Burkholderia sp. Ac-20379]
MQSTDNVVFAFVPGTSASELNLSASERAWPEALELVHVLKYEYDQHCKAVAHNVDLAVGDLVGQFQIGPKTLPCYGSLINFMHTNGFVSAIPSTCKPLKSATKPLTAPSPRVFYHCPYDWRETNEDSARKLGDALKELDDVYAAAGQTYKLYIIGHSMGGLVSRCLLENPDSKSTPWFNKAQALITLATPHYGAPLSLKAMLGQELLQLDLVPPAVMKRYEAFIQSVVNNPEFPSTYELLPPPGKAFIQDTKGNALDVYNAASTEPFMGDLTKFGFSPTSAQKARKFFLTLTVSSPDNTPIPYYCFVGTGNETFASSTSQLAFTYQPNSSKAEADPFVPSVAEKVGDGVVPADSARFIFQLDTPQCPTFEGYTHGQMGGSDMDGHKLAIEAIFTLAGLPVKHAAPLNESTADR